MEPNYSDFLDDQIDMKQRLKAQLDELQEEVKSFYSDRSESPRSSFSKQNSPIKPVFSSFEKPKKQDDLKQLKQEVASWSSCIKEMQTSIEKLSKQLNSIEKNFQNRDYSNELQDFKEEIIQEIKNMEFGSSSFRESQHFSENPEEVFKKMLNQWEEQVYRPQINTLTQKVKNSVERKEDPQDIMKKLKEKLALKAELEKRKQVLGC
jgi:uncharacterized coiled-coil protein SlyX